MSYKPPIKGKILKKKSEQPQDLVGSLDGVVKLVGDLQNIKSDVIETVNNKLDELDTVIAQVKEIKKGEDGQDADAQAIADYVLENIELPKDGIDGKDADEELIIEKVLAKIPKAVPIDEKKLKKEILSSIPDRKADLKIIQENIEIDPMSVIEKIMALPDEKRKKLQLGSNNISGLDQTIQSLNSQLSRGYLHGGGISKVIHDGTLSGDGTSQSPLSVIGAPATSITGLIEAGTNVTIDGTGTLLDPYIINTTGGVMGSIQEFQVGFGSHTNTLTSSNNFIWDNDNFSLLVGEHASSAGMRFNLDNQNDEVFLGNIDQGINFSLDAQSGGAVISAPNNIIFVGAIGFGLLNADMANHIISIGDVFAGGNHTVSSVDDANSQITDSVHGTNLLNEQTLNTSGFSQVWDANTTDGIQTNILQSQDILSAGFASGSAMTWTNSDTGTFSVAGTGDLTGGGLYPGTSYLVSSNSAFNANALIYATFQTGSNSAVGAIDISNGDVASGSSFTKDFSDISFRNDIIGYIARVRAEANDTSLTYTSNGVDSSGVTAETGQLTLEGSAVVRLLNGTGGISAYFDTVNYIATIGDTADNIHGTKFRVDDNGSIISSIVNGTFQVQNLSNNQSVLVDTNNYNVYLGDISSAAHHTSLLLNDNNSTIIGTGNQGVSQSSINFSGGGPNDLSASILTTFSGIDGQAYTVAITHVNTQNVSYTGISGGSFNIGDTITVTAGTGIGTTGTVFADNGTTVRLENVVGLVIAGDTIDNGSGVTATVTTTNSSLFDLADWSDTNGGSGTVGLALSPQTLSNNVQVQWGSATGHQIGDMWQWSYTFTYGRMLYLDGQNQRYIFGDLDTIGNGVQLDINNLLNTLTFKFASGVQYTFPSTNSAGALTNDGSGGLSWQPGGVGGSITAGQVGYGDPSNLLTSDSNFTWDATNKVLVAGGADTFLVVQDNSQQAYVATGGKFFVTDSSTANKYFQIDVGNHLYEIGDLNNVGNSNKFSINDSAGTAITQVSVGTGVTDTSGNYWYTFLTAAHASQIGDISSAFNKVLFTVDDLNLAIIANTQGGIFSAGDTSMSNNGTFFSINDTLKIIRASGGMVYNYIAVTGTYAILRNDYVVDCTANTFTATLPTAVGFGGQPYVVKNSGVGIITLATTSAQTIDGASTQTLTTKQSLTVMSNGTNWIII